MSKIFIICMAIMATVLCSGGSPTCSEEIVPIVEDIEPIIESVPEEILVELPVVVEETIDTGLLQKSNLTAEQLEEALYYRLADYAEVFIEAEEETGVNAIFLASVAALESGWGRSKVAKNKNNLYGWTTDTGDYKTFESHEECIKFIAHKFKELYLSPDGRYFTGYEVKNINYYYNGRQAWEDAVNNIMDGILRRALKSDQIETPTIINTTK